MPSRYSDDDLLDALRELADDLGERPRARDVNEHDGLPSSATYGTRFGSWNAALEAAGFGTHGYSDEELLDVLRNLAAELGRTPSADHVRECDDAPNISTYQDRFGGYNAALEAALLDVNETYAHTDEELLDDLVRLIREQGRAPTKAVLEDKGRFGQTTYSAHFGSWAGALAELGLTPNQGRPTDRELIAALREFANYGSVGPTASLSKRDMDERGPHSYRLYRERFGSWDAALVEAGLNPTSRLTREELLEAINELAAAVGLDHPGASAPTVHDLIAEGRYSLHPFIHEFGSWNEAVEAAGYIPNEGRPVYSPEYSMEELLAELRRVADDLNETPTTETFAAHSSFGTTTYELRFGSWHRALELAGLRSRRQSPGETPRGSTREIDIDRRPGTADAPRIDRLRMRADGVPHMVKIGDALLDEYSEAAYEILAIDAHADALAPVWTLTTQPYYLDRPLTRTYYGDELRERLAGGTLTVRSS